MTGPGDRSQPTGAFWSFSVAMYARPDVSRACLALQDAAGLDVNLLLFCCWLGTRGIALGASEMGAVLGTVRDWQEQVVQPLRTVRRFLNPRARRVDGSMSGELRAAVARLELEAERVEQSLLERAASSDQGADTDNGLACAVENLRAYLGIVRGNWGEPEVDNLAMLLRGVFEGLPPGEAQHLAASVKTGAA